jgi:hypothetical protein
MEMADSETVAFRTSEHPVVYQEARSFQKEMCALAAAGGRKICSKGAATLPIQCFTSRLNAVTNDASNRLIL